MSKFRNLIESIILKETSTIKIPTEEAKQVGILYHATDLDSALKILETNKIFAYRDIGISTSRHLNSLYNINNPIIFVLDGDKISNNYKTEPFNYYNKNDQDFETVIQTNKSKYYKRNNINYPLSIINYKNWLNSLENTDDVESDFPTNGSELLNLSKYLIKIIVNTKHISKASKEDLIKLKQLSPVPIEYKEIKAC